jgi:hypothetical protein
MPHRLNSFLQLARDLYLSEATYASAGDNSQKRFNENQSHRFEKLKELSRLYQSCLAVKLKGRMPWKEYKAELQIIRDFPRKYMDWDREWISQTDSDFKVVTAGYWPNGGPEPTKGEIEKAIGKANQRRISNARFKAFEPLAAPFFATFNSLHDLCLSLTPVVDAAFDRKAYRQANEIISDNSDVVPNIKKLHKILKENPGIRIWKPSKHRLMIHVGDWLDFKKKQAGSFEKMDEYMAGVEERKRKIRNAKLGMGSKPSTSRLLPKLS